MTTCSDCGWCSPSWCRMWDTPPWWPLHPCWSPWSWRVFHFFSSSLCQKSQCPPGQKQNQSPTRNIYEIWEGSWKVKRLIKSTMTFFLFWCYITLDSSSCVMTPSLSMSRKLKLNPILSFCVDCLMVERKVMKSSNVILLDPVLEMQLKTKWAYLPDSPRGKIFL